MKQEQIAIPEFEERISPLFDVAGKFHISRVEDGVVGESYVLHVDPEGGFQKIDALSEVGVDVVICGAISRMFARCVMRRGMTLVPNVSGRVEEVLQAYCCDELSMECYSLPGCRWRGQGKRGQCPRFRGEDQF